MKNTLVIIALMISSKVAYSQTCNSSDKRDMVEQLDCYCSANDKSLAEQKFEKLGTLAGPLKIQAYDCATAAGIAFAVSNDKKIEKNITKKLETLNFPVEKIEAIVKPAAKKAHDLKLVSSAPCSKSSFSLKLGPLSFGNSSKSEECVAFEKLSADEIKSAYALSNYKMFVNHSSFKDSSIFSTQLKQLELAEVVDLYPKEKILNCAKLLGGASNIDKCAAVSDEKIDGCQKLAFSSAANALQCLALEVDKINLSACSHLSFDSEANRLACLELRPGLVTASLCKSLDFLSEANRLTCVRTNPEKNVALSCKHMDFLSEANRLACLETKPEIALATSCSKLDFLSEANRLTCLKTKVNQDIIAACGELKMISEANRLTCLNIGAQPDKIHQCGLKDFGESKTLDCIRTAYNEAAANAQVSNSKRAPKDKISEDSTTTTIVPSTRSR